MHKTVSRNTCCFHRIAVFADEKVLFIRLGSSVIDGFCVCVWGGGVQGGATPPILAITPQY